MRVIFLVNIPSPYRVDFFNELGKSCDLTVLFEREETAQREWKTKECRNFRAVFLKGVKTKGSMGFCPGVGKYLRKEIADVFVIGGYATPTGMLAVQILKNRKIPFYLNADGGLIKTESRRVFKIKQHFIGSADYWLSTGESTTHYLKHYGAREEKIFTYPFTSLHQRDILDMPVDTQQKSLLRAELGMGEKNVILSVGQFIYRKGFDVLIKAQKFLDDDTGIYIVGGNSGQKYAQELQTVNSEKIHFIAFKDPHELEKYYRAANLFVLPTREDIWGLVINEAMANGLPVITTDRCVAGCELVRDGVNGYIIPVEDAHAIAEKSNYILSNNLADKMGACALETIRDFSIEAMAQKHIEIFQRNL